MRVNRETRIKDLQQWRNEHLFLNPDPRQVKSPEFMECVFAIRLCDYLIEEIRNAPKSMPAIQVVREYRDKMDQVLCESPDDHLLTHRFAGIMERLALDILRRWQKEGDIPPWL